MRYITVEDLSFQYDNEPVLEGINYHLDSGEFVTLTGENGAAKSTLVKATLGILTLKSGQVTIQKRIKRGRSSALLIYHSKLRVLTQVSINGL